MIALGLITFLAILMGRTLPPVRSVVIYGCATVGATVVLLGYGWPDRIKLSDMRPTKRTLSRMASSSS